MHAINTLAPIFLIMFLGAVLRRGGFFDDTAQTGMNRLSYWVGLPVLLFLETGRASAGTGAALTITKLVLAVTALLIGLGLLGARLMGLRAAQVGTFVQSAFRGNLAFIGLPVVLFAFAGSPDGKAAQAAAALALGPIIVVYNLVAVTVLLLSEGRFTLAGVPRLLGKMATNPLLIATVLGLGWNAWATRSGAALYPFVERTLSMLGATALPLALLCVGAAIVSTPLHGIRASAVFASAIKVAVGPAACFLLARLTGAGPMETGIAAIMSATPTAVSSYVLVDQLNGDRSLAAAGIVISTLMSVISLTVVVVLI
jgi:malate permease and related proteins